MGDDNGMALLKAFGIGQSAETDVSGYDEDINVEGVSDEIADQMQREDVEVGSIMSRALELASRRSRRPSTILKTGARATQKILPHVQRKVATDKAVAIRNAQREAEDVVRKAMLEEIGTLRGKDSASDNQKVPFTSDGTVAAGASVDFVYVTQNKQVWVDFNVSQAVADAFVATTFSIGTWEYAKHGGKVTGGTNGTELPLDDFVNINTLPASKPLRGRILENATQVNFTFKNITAAAAFFKATLSIQLLEVTDVRQGKIPNLVPEYPRIFR